MDIAETCKNATYSNIIILNSQNWNYISKDMVRYEKILSQAKTI